MPKVLMPRLGERVAEGTIGRWLKRVGDRVAEHEPIVEVITDKANAEIPSPFAGVLSAILVQEGETVSPDAEIASIEMAGEAAHDASRVGGILAAQPPPGRAFATPASAADGHPEIRATPAVRRLARDHGLVLLDVPGTGPSGRITRQDVLTYAATQRTGATSPSPAASASRAANPPTGPAPAGQPSLVAVGDSLRPMTSMRRAIATQMTRAIQAPVAYTTIEVNMSGVVARREVAKHDYQTAEGIGLSFVAFVTKAVAEALKDHPDLNGHWTEEGLWRRSGVNIGIAVAVDDGLVVPVIRDADILPFRSLNRAINELADRARRNRLRLEDVQDGTFTVDNTGWTGSVSSQPILNVPEVGILTMESIVKRPVVVETPEGDAITIRAVMNMCLGFDHRATDGAQAGRFIQDVRRRLEAVDARTSIG